MPHASRPTVPGVAPRPATGEIPSLNGIRALAVALVFFSHGGQGQVVPGGLGVTIFFVLSGFLITTLLRREYAAGGALDLRAFYLRRVLRLMPPLFIVAGVAGLLASASVIAGEFSTRGLISVLFYFGNYHVIATDFDGIPAGLGVIWSLAVEEHYYLLYPPLVLVLLRGGRPWLSAAILASLCVAILAWRCWLYLNGASAAHLTMATDTRADAILIGCVMAFAYNPALGTTAAPRPGRDLGIALGCLLLLLGTLLYREEAFRLTVRYTLQCLAIAPLIYLSITHAAAGPVRWLNSRPMVYVGTISYTVYLSHQVAIYGVVRHAPEIGWPATLVIAAMLTLAIAEPMRRWVERPCGRLRRRLHNRTRRQVAQPDSKSRVWQ